METLVTRQQQLNTVQVSPHEVKSVLYIMSRDQRLHDNHALLIAQNKAIELTLPLIVGFALYPKSTKRAKEYVDFMLDGLQELSLALQQHNIPLVVQVGNPFEVYRDFVNQYRPAAVYFDMSPLQLPTKLRLQFAKQAEQPVYVVDTHNIVPLWQASNKQEYAARTFRPKFHRQLDKCFVEPDSLQSSTALSKLKMKASDFQSLKNQIDYTSAGVNHGFTPGEQAARDALQDFLINRLDGYASKRNDPTVDGLSSLSPYLHFGQISSLRILLEASFVAEKTPKLREDYEALLEEMGVRKELSDNYCYYNQSYDSLVGAPEWAQKTIAKHANDHREYIYSLTEFEQAKTHDMAWNAAQQQLRQTGKIHGYMRMYWAKKVLEWSDSAESAIDTLIYLNDFYSIDGGDPNGYVGILWSVAGLHDRPWQERSVYGTIRSMTYGGLKRKFDVQAYIDKYINK